MNRIAVGVASVCLFVAASSLAQSAPATDIYHVHFAKAALGQAKALETQLTTPDPKDPMSAHTLVLKHQDGDDWDYAVIHHLGKKFTLDAANYPAAPTSGAPSSPAISAWHTDTFVAGPSWEEFVKQMGGDGGVYIVETWRAAPGHRQELAKVINAGNSDSKVHTGNVTMMHMEGSPWQFLTLQRYNSWQDFAADEAASQDAPGWYAIREHGAWHHDTITTRVSTATK